MLSWLMGVVLCMALLSGCGGGPKTSVTKLEPVPPEDTNFTAADLPDESLTEELSSKRLEELYAKSGIPGWDPSLEAELKNWEHQVKFDVPIQMNKQVRAYLVYFSTERKAVITRYLARSTRYLPIIKKVFQEYGLPEDLAYLAMIESGYNNKATSPAAACGMWQFIRGTGLRYGLTIDSYVDERRDPEKATRAAAKYLLDLYKQFGSWYLAAASYNCGEGRVQRELDQSKHKNFWELSANMCLPTETKNYVPQMIAATIIAKSPEKFGFRHIPYQPPMKVDKVQVNEPTSLKAVAFAINMQAEDIQILNPALLRGVTPPDSPNYTLNLPPSSKGLFSKNITLARIEYPAVASRPVWTAKKSGGHHHYARSRHHSSRQVATAPKHKVHPMVYAKKFQPAAAVHRKSTGATIARKTRSHEGKEAHTAVQASMFGGFGASKHHASAGKARGKSQTVARTRGPKKTAATRLARRENSGKRTGKSKTARRGKSTSKSKDKYSKAKTRALFASKAR
jgi:soluble lytic murein transglycosylase-like protein